MTEKERRARLKRMKKHAKEDSAAARPESVVAAPEDSPAPPPSGAAPDPDAAPIPIKEIGDSPLTTGASSTPGPPGGGDLPRKKYKGMRDPKRRVPDHIRAAARRAEERIAARDGRPPPEDDTEPAPEAGPRVAVDPEIREYVPPPEPSLIEAYAVATTGARPAYRPELDEIARSACEAGATDWDLALLLGIGRATLNRWKLEHPSFRDSIKLGKDSVNEHAKRTFYERAVGYNYEEEDIKMYKGSIIRTTVVKHLPPDVGALAKFLAARCPEEWGKLDADDRAAQRAAEEAARLANIGMIELGRRIAYLLNQGAQAAIQGGKLSDDAGADAQ
jgi:hypothetical protein